MPSRYFQFFLLLILVSGCRPASTETEPRPVITEPSSPTISPKPLSARNNWVILPTNQAHNYRATTNSLLESAEMTLSASDSMTVTADFSLAITRELQAFSYSATLQALSIHGSTRAPTTSPAIMLPFSISGHFHSGQLTVDSPAKQEILSTDCASQLHSAIPIIHRSIVVVPVQLRTDMTWTDSISTAVCSGSAPVTLTALRNYRVLGETSIGPRRGILLERQDRTLSTGEGTEGQHRVQLRSESSGQTQLLIDEMTGSLIEATSTTTTSIVVTTSGRSQKFVQTSRERVTER